MAYRPDRWARRSVVGFIAVLAGLVGEPALAQGNRLNPFDPPTIGEVIGENAQQALQELNDLRATMAESSADIQEVRRQYFRALASGQRHPAVEERFARLLLAKDLYYFSIAVSEGTDGPRGQLLGGLAPVDGGISPVARTPFEFWVGATRAKLGARDPGQMVIVGPDAIVAAISPSNEYYVAYRRVRDLAEYFTSGIDLTKAMSPMAYAQGLFEVSFAVQMEGDPGMPRDMPEKLAAERMKVLVGVVGERVVSDAAKKVMLAPKGSNGLLDPPIDMDTAIGRGSVRQPLDYFQSLLLKDDRGYALTMITYALGSRPSTEWRDGGESYRWLVDHYGEAKVREAAGQLRAAPMNRNGQIVLPGGEAEWPGRLLRTMVTDPSFRLDGNHPPKGPNAPASRGNMAK